MLVIDIHWHLDYDHTVLDALDLNCNEPQTKVAKKPAPATTFGSRSITAPLQLSTRELERGKPLLGERH